MKKSGRPRVWNTCKECGHRGRIDEDFYVWTDKGKRRVSAVCRPCARARARARYAAIMGDPYLREVENRRKRSWDSERRKREANADRCRRYREKLKRERPAVYRQQLEDARIRNSRRHEGRVTTKRSSVWEEPTGARRLRLDPGPLVAFLARLELGTLSDTDQRIVFRLFHENAAHVALPVADRIITHFDGALANVYPELYA